MGIGHDTLFLTSWALPPKYIINPRLLPPGNWMTDTRTGKQYIVLDTVNFTHAGDRKLCEQQGGRLPEPRDEDENNFLDSLNTEMFSLGMTDENVEGQWVWDSDGSKVTWFNWAKYDGIPNGGTTDNCAYMVRNTKSSRAGHTKKSWADKRCHYYDYYDKLSKQLVCERDGQKGKSFVYVSIISMFIKRFMYLLCMFFSAISKPIGIPFSTKLPFPRKGSKTIIF